MVLEEFLFTIDHLRSTFLHNLFTLVGHLNLHRGMMCFNDSITDACDGIINAFLGYIEGFYKFFYILAFMFQSERIVDDMCYSQPECSQLLVKVSRLFLIFLLLLNMGDEL